VQRLYDTDADGRPDFAELLAPNGRIRQLQYRLDDPSPADTVDLDRIAPADCPHLVIILDSVPFTMVRDLWNQGRFRLFAPPTRAIATFPVMTDLSLSEFFHASPCPGIESQYYDGHHLTNGYLTYAEEKNTPWLAYADYHLNPIDHSEVYGHPHVWFDHELRRIQELFYQKHQRCFIGYCVGPSALGAKFGRDGHLAGLIRLDRFCQQIFYRARGKVQITLFSDHGHNLVRSRRIPLTEFLRECGYHVGDSLQHPGDVVVPEFGVVTCAAVHTRQPAAVARDLLGLEGVDLTAYLDRGRGRPGSQGDRIIVLSRTGRASITHSDAGFRYETLPQLTGDPLELGPVLNLLRRQGRLDADGFVSDRVLFDATADGEYPDAVHRLWRAFHGLVKHTPDVLVSVKDGWHCGSPFMTDLLQLSAAHGNLNPLSSTAFVMTTVGKLPPVVRMEDLRAALINLGVPLPTKTPKK